MLPLEGIRVLDLSNYVPGALCTMILGDMGAEVIKIEPAEPLAFEGVGYSVKGEERRRETAFFTLNRNKKSLGLNLRSAEGRDVFLKMAKDADIVIEGYRPGVVKRMGIELGIIAVPPGRAREVADRLMEAGVKGIVNFAPTIIASKDNGCVVRNMDIGAELRIISAITDMRKP